MRLNPVWHRELRARWRGWRAFVSLFAYVVVLAGVLLWSYNDFLNHYPLDQFNFDPRRRMSLLGHELFSVLTWLQAALWMLIAPVLTATSITSERERGLLEGLQLSRLKAGEIARGKLFSALSFCALLILVTLPIEAVCFLMGGVSPAEFLSALALHASTAVACAAMGLAVSSWSRKSLSAMSVSIVLSIAWGVGSFIAFNVAYSPVMIAAANFPLELFGQTNPILAAVLIAEPRIVGMLTSSVGIESWIVSVIFSLVSTLFWMWLAARGESRILGEPKKLEWARVRRELDLQNSAAQNATLQNTNASTRAPEADKTKPAKRLELGFLSRLQFSNPVLGREVRACFRPRSSSPIMVGLAILLAPFALGAFGWGIFEAVFDSYAREGMSAILLMIHLVVVIVMCAIMGAGSFAREREASTLLSLRLSLLTPREILVGKMGTPLLLCAFCGVVFLPILLPCVRQMVYRPSGNGLSLSQLAGALILIASTAWCLTLVGLTFSWFSKRVVTATCWTVGTLFAFYIGAPALLLSISPSPKDEELVSKFFRWWHPVFGMSAILDRRFSHDYSRSSTLGDAISFSLILIVIGAVLLWVLKRRVLAAQGDSS